MGEARRRGTRDERVAHAKARAAKEAAHHRAVEVRSARRRTQAARIAVAVALNSGAITREWPL